MKLLNYFNINILIFFQHEVSKAVLINHSSKSLKLLKSTLLLTLVAQRPPEAREAITLSCDVVARPVTVDTLRTRLAAAMAEVARRANCRGRIGPVTTTATHVPTGGQVSASWKQDESAAVQYLLLWQVAPLYPGAHSQVPSSGEQEAPFLQLQGREQLGPQRPSAQTLSQ